jgi:hypothetical protein
VNQCAAASPTHIATFRNTTVDTHSCGICTFLFQANGQPVEIASGPDWHPLVAGGSDQPRFIHLPISLGLQAPRGPPILG